MVRGSVVAIAALLVAGTASAADLGRMPVKAPAPVLAPAYNWSGFYLGANLGYGWGKSDGINTDGVLGGGQIGYNWQFPDSWLLGLEAQFSAANIKGSESLSDGTIAVSESFKAKWLGSITGKVGYAADNWLFYAKGGLGLADYDSTLGVSVAGVGSVSSSASKTLTGWTIGAGAEWGFAPNWSALIEYQYYDFGSNTFDHNFAGNAFPVSADNNIHTIKAGVNYHFGVWR